MNNIKLTSYSHGAGCGCKLSPGVLDSILAETGKHQISNPDLLVGNDRRDDAAALRLPDGNVLLSTTDFFMPIVDDPYDFGRIAATNAISDIYAMGGTPVLALGILGWPINKIPAEVAREVMLGGQEVCKNAGFAISGGHSIDAPEPIFGLAVNGIVKETNLKTNGGAKADDLLYLTKPLGTGLITTAEKAGKVKPEDKQRAVTSMTTLNKIGSELAPVPGVHAITDVTGFGLLGHLKEVCLASQVSAEVDFNSIPWLCDLSYYTTEKTFPGGTKRNWESYGHYIHLPANMDNDELKLKLCDPQTSGGLLLSVSPSAQKEVEDLIAASPFPECGKPIGQILPRGEDNRLINIFV